MAQRLFCYGTLEFAEIVRALIGTVPPSRQAILSGYARYRIKGKHYPGITAQFDANVAGTLYNKIAPSQLQKLDRYEGAEYRRCRVNVSVDGVTVTAWTYVVRQRYPSMVSAHPWQKEQMRPCSGDRLGRRLARVSPVLPVPDPHRDNGMSPACLGGKRFNVVPRTGSS